MVQLEVGETAPDEDDDADDCDELRERVVRDGKSTNILLEYVLAAERIRTMLHSTNAHMFQNLALYGQFTRQWRGCSRLRRED